MTHKEMTHWINIVRQEEPDEKSSARILSDPDELTSFMKLYGYPLVVPLLDSPTTL